MRRAELLGDSVAQLCARQPRHFRETWRVKFVGEPGVDSGGVSREVAAGAPLFKKKQTRHTHTHNNNNNNNIARALKPHTDTPHAPTPPWALEQRGGCAQRGCDAVLFRVQPGHWGRGDTRKCAAELPERVSRDDRALPPADRRPPPPPPSP